MRKNKEIITGKENREKLLAGVDKLANAVKATLGPRGRNVAIEKESGPPFITKDGVTVARFINLEDNVENMGAQLVKSVASNANSVAGDGTTTATVLAQSIYSVGVSLIDENNYNPVLLKRGIDYGLQHVLKYIDAAAIKINDDASIKQVAIISANNDHDLGSQIGEAMCAVGKDGLVIVEEAQGRETTITYSDGLKLDRGLLSEVFITNPSRQRAELEDCKILTYIDKITKPTAIESIFKYEFDTLFNADDDKQPKNLLLIAKDFDVSVLQAIAQNNKAGVISCVPIKAPGFGDVQKAMLQDTAIMTGGKLISDENGGLPKITVDSFGLAKKVIVSQNSTVIYGGNVNNEELALQIQTIKNQLSEGDLFSHQIDVLSSRLARLSGSIAIIRVGGATEAEVLEKKDRVEDAVNAVTSALDSGVVAGGGSTLLRASANLLQYLESDYKKILQQEEIAGIKLLARAMTLPITQILINAGFSQLDIQAVISNILTSNSLVSGYDAYKLEFKDDMISSGIIDPAKVVKTALEKAASAAGTLLTTEVSISLFENKK